mmetsp:Transcript_24730/g.38506  ORF Transcript_24730/g.38506 Transcript_24730/m.38506 type:complete len:111 (-) Transcript_24730:23-355(-)
MEAYDKVNRRMLRQRAQLEDAQELGYAAETMANDIKVNLKGQSQQMETRTLRNLHDIQEQASISGKLLSLIEQQRKRNKYIIYGVYLLLALLAGYIVGSTLGLFSPSDDE